MKPQVIIPWWRGTNCHRETKFKFEQAGARVDVVPIVTLREGKRRLSDTDLIVFAGGFSEGDYGWGAGCAAAIDLVYVLGDQLQEAVQRRIPIGGFCNGAQTMTATGLLPSGARFGTPAAVLDVNLSALFEHWVATKIVLHDCGNLWTRGLDGVELITPSAHHEGRLVCEEPTPVFDILGSYGTYDGDVTMSPNGSPIAGIGSPDKTRAWFMPHPERNGEVGLHIIRNGVDAVR